MRNLSLSSALLTLPLNFWNPEAAVIFLESICLIRVGHMDADNLSSARRAGTASSIGRGESLGAFAK